MTNQTLIYGPFKLALSSGITEYILPNIGGSIFFGICYFLILIWGIHLLLKSRIHEKKILRCLIIFTFCKFTVKILYAIFNNSEPQYL